MRASLLVCMSMSLAACAAPQPQPKTANSADSAAARDDTGLTHRAPRTAASPVTAAGFDVEAVDPVRYIIDRDVLVQVILDAATGVIPLSLTTEGYRIGDIASDSLITRLGLGSGDVVVAVNQVAVSDIMALRNHYGELRSVGDIRLEIRRGGQPHTVHYALRSSLPDRVPRESEVVRDTIQTSPAYLDAQRFFEMGVSSSVSSSVGIFQEREIDKRVLDVLKAHPSLLDVGLERVAGGGVARNHRPSLYSALGLTEHDILTSISTTPVDSLGDVERGFGKVVADEAFTLTVHRLRDPLTFRFRVVEGRSSSSDVEQYLAGWRELDAKRDNPRGYSEKTRAERDDLSALLDAAVTRRSETEYTVKRALFERVLANTADFARSARVVPAIKNGKAVGFKLYAIRRSTLLHRLGLRNGDTITAVNGQDISSPDRALEVYTQVRKADTIKLAVVRRGTPVTIEIRVE